LASAPNIQKATDYGQNHSRFPELGVELFSPLIATTPWITAAFSTISGIARPSEQHIGMQVPCEFFLLTSRL
jgi:hypothetical protein